MTFIPYVCKRETLHRQAGENCILPYDAKEKWMTEWLILPLMFSGWLGMCKHIQQKMNRGYWVGFKLAVWKKWH